MTTDNASPLGGPEMYRALIECSRNMYTLVDSQGIILYQSPSIGEMLGWKAEDTVGRSVMEYAHIDDRAGMLQEFQEVLKHPAQARRVILRMLRQDEGWQDLDSLLRNEIENPDIGGVVIETRELVTGPELHRGLQNSEHLFRTVLSHPSLILWAIDNKGIITVSEGEGLRQLGIEPGVLVGTNVFDLYVDTPHVLPSLRRALAGETLDYTLAVPGPGGDLTMDNRLRPQFSNKGEVVGVTAISFEVSERVELENKLRRAETLEAIGMLVGGVAHDFNNLLTAVIGFATVAKRADDAKRDEYLDHVVESADRGASLVKQLLSFARKDEIRPETVDVSELLGAGMPLYRQVLGQSVTVDLDVDQDAECHIRIDRTKLEQVLLNLVTNARDAMPEGGNLQLHLSHADERSGERCVQIDVVDDGMGMDADTLKCVFDPFFSTKQTGTGLGLATSHSIVSRAGGSLTVESEVGQGARFQLRFECHQPAVRTDTKVKTSATIPRPGGVLLIDDNLAVLRSTALTLEQAGFTVQTAKNGQEGYDLFVKDRSPFDIVVTDMTMPGMKGDELAQLLRKLDSETPILCVSGYHNHASELTELPRVTLLSKPYRGSELVDAISKILSEL